MEKKKLLLRPFQPDDESRILDILTDKTVSETYMLPDFSCRSDAIPLFHRLMALSHDQNRYVRCISLDGIAVGYLNDVVMKDDSIELGYVIHPDSQGKGYMTEALKIAIEQLHATKYPTVICGAFEGNEASMRVMVKSGMKRIDYTDTVDYRGKTYPCIYYAATKENSYA